MDPHTVIGTFENSTDAQTAINDLATAGFPRNNIQMHPAADASLESDITTTNSAEHSSVGIARLLRALFGMDDDYRRHHDIYSESIRRGHYVVTVHPEDQRQLDMAADILNRHHPIDVDELAGQWQREGWTGSNEPSPLVNRGEAGAAVQPGMEDRIQRRGSIRIVRHTVIAVSPAGLVDDMAGATADTSGASSGWVGAGDADDADYRHHWQSTYGPSGGRYEDYGDAYRYGAHRAGSGRYANYRWTEAEPDLRRDWETSHPGNAWDRVKDAVRYGMERGLRGAPTDRLHRPNPAIRPARCRNRMANVVRRMLRAAASAPSRCGYCEFASSGCSVTHPLRVQGFLAPVADAAREIRAIQGATSGPS